MEENKNEKLKQFFSKRFSIKKRKMTAAGAVYAALAVCIVAAAIISIASINSSMNKLPVEGDLSLPEISLPPVDTSKPGKTDLPVNLEQSNVPEETRTLFCLPVDGEILKGYHMEALVYSTTMKDYRTHSGIDIAGKIGDAVKCYTDGYVTAIEDDPFMGKTVIVTHEYGLKSKYQNLANELPDGIKVGAAVKAGDTIGAVGETAIIEGADAPHVHFELILDGELIDCEKELAELNEEE